MRTGSDVDARLAAADAWLAAGLSSALQPALRDGTSLRGLKAICEIAFFVATRLRRYDPILVQAVDDCLAQVLDGGRLLGMARHNIQHANLFLPLLYACFRRGLLDRRSVADVRLLADLALAQTMERIPFRSVDLLHVCWKLTGRRTLFAAMNDAARRGCLRAGANVTSLSTADDYAVTHTVFYCTDFGARAWPAGLAGVPELDAILASLAWRPDNRNNFDLRGEFVLARRYLRTPVEALAGELSAIASVSRPDGSWPAPADVAHALREENVAQAHWPFLTDYHTTLVCAEALAACRPRSASRWPRPASRPARALRARSNRESRGLPARGPVATLVRAYCRLATATVTELPASLLADPSTVVPAVEWHLVRRVLGRPPQRTPRALQPFTAIAPARAWNDMRLARVVLTAGLAREGRAHFAVHATELRHLLARLRDMPPYAIETDEACVLALGLPAFADADAAAAHVILDKVLIWRLGQADIAAVMAIANMRAVSLRRAAPPAIEAFIRSFDARSLPFGFVPAVDEPSRAVAGRLAIARAQHRVIGTRLRKSVAAASRRADKIGPVTPLP